MVAHGSNVMYTCAGTAFNHVPERNVILFPLMDLCEIYTFRTSYKYLKFHFIFVFAHIVLSLRDVEILTRWCFFVHFYCNNFSAVSF